MVIFVIWRLRFYPSENTFSNIKRKDWTDGVICWLGTDSTDSQFKKWVCVCAFAFVIGSVWFTSCKLSWMDLTPELNYWSCCAELVARRRVCRDWQISLLDSPSFNIRRPQTAAVQHVGQVGEVAAEGFQLRQRLLALQPGEPVRWQTLNHLR